MSKIAGDINQVMLRNCSLTDNMRDDDAARWRWITRDGRTRELRIPADENKASIDAAIDSKRLMLPNDQNQGPR